MKSEPSSKRTENKIASGENSNSRKGLNVEIHPALLSENVNLIRHQDNPYLEHEKLYKITGASKVAKRYSRGLKFHEPGVLSKQIEEQRAQLAKQEEVKKQEDEIKKAKVRTGELPDKSIGEHNYLITSVPQIEWWDVSYVENTDTWEVKQKYEDCTIGLEESEEEDEKLKIPSLRYVQHPVPVTISESTEGQQVPKVYLVRKEQKKIRRNRRKLLREEHEEKVRLGLKPKPVPKVKLSNIMNVYQNSENISDPTSWEQTVKAQVEERHQKHVETNIRRHLEAQERKQELSAHHGASSTNSEFHCKVFLLSSLRNPKIRYKLATNSRQLKLRGVCLRVGEDGPGILVVIGSEKHCRFYSKLVLQRIKWTDSFLNSDTGQLTDCSNDVASLAWEGILKETRFHGWFMKECKSSAELNDILSQYDADWLYRLFEQENSTLCSTK
ncbi:LANO_0H11254g1_1 [Lachancea nothofagi CBS 11611]|uniref:LANO_0H11254g1_1 n=1 Tax=Lachancea nothofagi CBS 11611 TaxID=1266666 RepID=A0A1G4KM34_9SACH|nr:LANO_0H11254g1_1 [Lachancea nothofagi CBS 11611]